MPLAPATESGTSADCFKPDCYFVAHLLFSYKTGNFPVELTEIERMYLLAFLQSREGTPVDKPKLQAILRRVMRKITL